MSAAQTAGDQAMNDDGGMSSHRDPDGAVKTFCYDASAHCLGSVDQAHRTAFVWDARPIDPAEAEQHRAAAAHGAAARRKPIMTHTFELRLCGSEVQEQSVPMSGPQARPSDFIVAIERVRAYLTRQGEAIATSAIGGVEVHAELRPSGMFCTAQLSDFGAGDLVVVQVDVALY